MKVRFYATEAIDNETNSTVGRWLFIILLLLLYVRLLTEINFIFVFLLLSRGDIRRESKPKFSGSHILTHSSVRSKFFSNAWNGCVNLDQRHFSSPPSENGSFIRPRSRFSSTFSPLPLSRFASPFPSPFKKTQMSSLSKLDALLKTFVLGNSTAILSSATLRFHQTKTNI